MSQLRVELEGVGKVYGSQRIFADISLELESGTIQGIKGHNGSGKSTLLRIISGFISPSKGSVRYIADGKELDVSVWPSRIAYCAPYLELIPALGLQEMVDLHFSFRDVLPGQSADMVIAELGFDPAKPVSDYSSGMYQKLKLALCMLTDAPLLLLDEPTANFDENGKEWYASMMERYAKDRIVVVASALDYDLALCGSRIDMSDYR